MKLILAVIARSDNDKAIQHDYQEAYTATPLLAARNVR
jgi:hypothetical protein